MVVIPKKVAKKWDKEIKKIPQELIEKMARSIHKHY